MNELLNYGELLMAIISFCIVYGNFPAFKKLMKKSGKFRQDYLIVKVNSQQDQTSQKQLDVTYMFTTNISLSHSQSCLVRNSFMLTRSTQSKDTTILILNEPKGKYEFFCRLQKNNLQGRK